MQDDSKDTTPQSPQPPKIDRLAVRPDRRRLLKALAGTGSVLAAGGIAPESWTRPVVQSILLPVHAQASCGGGQGYIGSVLLNATGVPTGMLDKVIPSAVAQPETMATANICISCNGDGTVNVRLSMLYNECPRPAFEGTNIPLGQYRDLPLANSCDASAATIRVDEINANAVGELTVQGAEFGFAGGFSLGPGTCDLYFLADCFALC